MSTQKTLLLVSAIALAGTALAIAAPNSDKEARRFPISLSDAQERAATRFATLDANGDELISLEEFLAGKAEHKRPHRRGNRDHLRHPRTSNETTLSAAEQQEQRA